MIKNNHERKRGVICLPGADALGHIGIGTSYSSDNFGAGLIGFSSTLGIGLSATIISIDGGLTITKVIYPKKNK